MMSTDATSLKTVALRRLAEAFDKTFSSTRLAIYLEGLIDIPAPVVKTVCTIAALECKFLPSLAELRERCGHGPDPSPPVNTQEADAQWAQAQPSLLPVRAPFTTWSPAHWRAYYHQHILKQAPRPGDPIIPEADHLAYRAWLGLPAQVTAGPLAADLERVVLPPVSSALVQFRQRHAVSP